MYNNKNNCMIYDILLPSALPCGEIHKGNTARWKSGKSANCKAETQPRGRKTDTRMKPDWFNDNPTVCEVTMAESSYIRHIAAPCQPAFIGTAGTCRNVTAVSEEKDVSRIRQSVVPTVITRTKRRLPKPECHKAMGTGPEYPARQRSSHSSLREGKPSTRRRGTVIDFNSING